MSRRFNIPEIGATIRLAEDWTFELYHEQRNSTLFEAMGLPNPPQDWRDRQANGLRHQPFTIPKGTTLKIDRIYIRKGKSEFSSLSFLWPGQKTAQKTVTRTAVRIGAYSLADAVRGPLFPLPTPPSEEFTYTHKIPARGVRFWAKLADVNRMVIEED